MGIKFFPSNFVYWENIENHEKIKHVIMKKVLELDNGVYKNHNPGGILNAVTNYGPSADKFSKYFDKDIIDQLVWNPFENLLKYINSNKNIPNINIKESFISSSWYTKYNENGTFRLHSHYNNGDVIMKNDNIYRPSFSIIYILNDKNERNSTRFSIMVGSPLSTVSNQEIDFNTRDIKEIKEGTVIIFPSSLYHEVLPVKIPGRITIAFNIHSSFVDECIFKS